MPYAYLPLEELKRRLDIAETDEGDDPTLRRVLEAASRDVDGRCGGRRFQPYTATRAVTPRWPDEIEVDDLLVVTALSTLTSNSDGTRTYGDTWATTDYDLEPYDAPDVWEPYTRIARNPAGRYAFPIERRGVQISGTWGYWLETEASGATLGAALDDSATSVTVSDGARFQRLQTLLIGTEALYVTEIDGNSLTVMRAQHGTTAASHSDAAAISVYVYPAPIVEATALLAARAFRRSDAPLGVVGSDAMGTAQRISSREPDAEALLRTFRRFHGAVTRG